MDIAEAKVTFGKSGWKLPGILTSPKDGNMVPAVILVHGSGPSDMDETVGPNKPFRDIAWGLAQRGIASLRYDKRTLAHGSKMIQDPMMTVFEEYVEDAMLAAEFLKTQQGIDTSRIYILGHSQGGVFIPRIAESTPNVRGYVILAGAVIPPMEDLIVEQTSYICGLDGAISDQEKQAIDMFKAMQANVKSLTPESGLTKEQTFGIPKAYWLDIQGYNPAEVAKAIGKPLLILQGERDYQATMDHFNSYRSVLGEKDNVTYKSYPDLNHLFLKGSGVPGPDEYTIPGKVEEQVIDDIALWISH